MIGPRTKDFLQDVKKAAVDVCYDKRDRKFFAQMLVAWGLMVYPLWRMSTTSNSPEYVCGSFVVLSFLGMIVARYHENEWRTRVKNGQTRAFLQPPRGPELN